MARPLVTVVVVSYNSRPYIQQAIESVRSQDYDNLEIIVVDNCSEDGTRDLLTSYYGDIKRIDVPERVAVGMARNLGISAARGEYLNFLDADDTFLPEKLHLQVEFARTLEPGAVTYCDGYLTAAGGQQATRFSTYRKPWSGSVTHALLKQNFILLHGALLPKSIYSQFRFAVIGSDESGKSLLSCGEDWNLWIQVSKQARFVYFDRPLVTYRRHLMNQTRQALGQTGRLARLNDEIHLRILEEHLDLDTAPVPLASRYLRLCLLNGKRSQVRQYSRQHPWEIRSTLYSALSYLPRTWIQLLARIKESLSRDPLEREIQRLERL